MFSTQFLPNQMNQNRQCTKRVRSPIYLENMTSDDFQHMNQRGGVFFYVLPHRSYTGFTESYESLKEWNQHIDFPDFDQNNE